VFSVSPQDQKRGRPSSFLSNPVSILFPGKVGYSSLPARRRTSKPPLPLSSYPSLSLFDVPASRGDLWPLLVSLFLRDILARDPCTLLHHEPRMTQYFFVAFLLLSASLARLSLDILSFFAQFFFKVICSPADTYPAFMEFYPCGRCSRRHPYPTLELPYFIG